MEVLPVLVPLKPLVSRLIPVPLREWFSDPQASPGRVEFPLAFRKAAYPALPGVVVPVPAKRVVNLFNEPERDLFPLFFMCPVVTLRESYKQQTRRSRGSALGGHSPVPNQ